jgi:hypothetical protein
MGSYRYENVCRIIAFCMDAKWHIMCFMRCVEWGCIGKLMVNRLEEPGFVEEVRRTSPHGEGGLRLTRRRGSAPSASRS